MFARKVVPMLLIAGGVMMFMRHKRLEMIGQGAEDDQPHPIGWHGPHGEWGKRVPPLFDAERWHKRAHEQDQPAQQPASPAPAA